MGHAQRSGRWCPRGVGGHGEPASLNAGRQYGPKMSTRPCSATTQQGACGGRGSLRTSCKGRDITADWEIRQNAVWRRGRVFLECPRCRRPSTRLYLPFADSWLACRRCWGLTYNSRALLNYKASLWGRGAFARMFGTSQRDWAYETTDENRANRRKASRERWAARRQWLQREKD